MNPPYLNPKRLHFDQRGRIIAPDMVDTINSSRFDLDNLFAVLDRLAADLKANPEKEVCIILDGTMYSNTGESAPKLDPLTSQGLLS